MKADNIGEAKKIAEKKSFESRHYSETIYIIYCGRTEYFYVTTDSLIRLWEQLAGYYVNGIYTTVTSSFR